MWPFDRGRARRGPGGASRPTAPTAPGASPASRAAWMDLAPIQRAVTPIELTAPSSRLERQLASWRSPQFLGELGHQVSAAASGGLAEGIAVAAPRDAEVPPMPEPFVRMDFARPAVVRPTEVTVARSLTTATDRVPDAAPRRLEVAAPSVQRASGFDSPHAVEPGPAEAAPGPAEAAPGPAEAAPGPAEAATAGPVEVEPRPAEVEPAPPVTRRLGLGPPITTLTPPDERASLPPDAVGRGSPPPAGRGAASLPGRGASPSLGGPGLPVSRAAEPAVPGSSARGAPTSGPRPPGPVTSHQASTVSGPSSGMPGLPLTPPPPAPRPGSADVSVQASRGTGAPTPPPAGPPVPGVEGGGREVGRPALGPLVGRTTIGSSIDPMVGTGDPKSSGLVTPGVGDPPLVPLRSLQARSGDAPDLPPAPATPEPPAALLGERVLPLMTQARGTAPDDGPPPPSPVPPAMVQRWLAPDLPQVAGPRGGTARTTDQPTRGTTTTRTATAMQRLTTSPTASPASRGVERAHPALTTVPTDLAGPSRTAAALQVAPAVAQRFGGTAPASPLTPSLPAGTPGLSSAVAAVVSSGVATIEPDGSLRFAPPTEPSEPGGGPPVQREAGDTTPSSDASQPATAPAEATATAATPASTPTSGAPGHPGTGPGDLDDLARRLYERIRARLRAELRLDMERAGMLTRPGR